MADNHLMEITHNSTPSPSIPLQLSGFLSGDTIQVQGDAQNVQFSLQFNIHNKHGSENQLSLPPAITPENQTCTISSSSSYMTPITTHEEGHQNPDQDPVSHAIDWISGTQECISTEKDTILTRLRSGVLSPVTYFPPRSIGNSQPWRKEVRRTKRKRNDVLKRVLKRHRFPIRPCSSYSFFVMTTWDVLKCASFGERSKKLGEMWCNLSHSERKVFEDMAVKDLARYKRQCVLLMKPVRTKKNFHRW
ncbi:hypothetical protein RJ640_026207 [Escallonia rubra]|uniref:HMG box domain-containing protein n=1 Tax=Escallonia rubra TaxID=112253 RepID=A0AA88RG25_9ASTE|nr:hypothetical protein RJ640_026207 [Escallonia rubra]